jgi:hypothetical protein
MNSIDGRRAQCGLRGVLFFVEDPGAANFVAPLVTATGESGAPCAALATGLAADILRRRTVPHREVERGACAESVLAEFRPRLVVIGTATNPDTLGLYLVAAARREAIPTVGVVDAAMNSALRFRGHGTEPLAFAPDWLLVPDELVAASFVELGMRSAQVIACGNPHYDYVMELGEKWRGEGRREFCLRIFPDAPPGRKIVVFAAEGSARVLGTPPERLASYSLVGRGHRSGRTEIALEELLDALQAVGPRPYLVLRAHPKDRLEDYAPYAGEISAISSVGDPFEIVFAADLVVGTTSMLVTEAALLGRPTVAIVPVPEEEGWLPSVKAGLTPVARIRTDLVRLLQEGHRSEPGRAGLGSLRGSRERALAALQRILGGTHTSVPQEFGSASA